MVIKRIKLCIICKNLVKDIRYIKHNDPQSAHALHILNNEHEYSPIKTPRH